MASQPNHWRTDGVAPIPIRLRRKLALIQAFAFLGLIPLASGRGNSGAIFHDKVQPILTEYCYDCHGDGMKKGGLGLDAFETDPARPENRELWGKVLRYVRSGIMPPANRPRPPLDERRQLANWIKFDAFGIDPNNLDPGRVTIRRLNRVEYGNTIRDLMGIEFPAEVEFPPDDTGYGFDDIGDVLTLSPMLLEKYVAAAKTIVGEAVPTVAKVMPEIRLTGSRFKSSETNAAAAAQLRETTLALPFDRAAKLSTECRVEHEGDYRLTLDLAVKGAFDFDPAKCRLEFKVDDQVLWRQEFGWHDHQSFRFDLDQHWTAANHRLAFALEPLTPSIKTNSPLELRLNAVTIHGPSDQAFWRQPKNYSRFFPKPVPLRRADRRRYANELLRDFAGRAFRRPADERTVERLSALAERIYDLPGKSFEEGIAHALVAVLSSPRFLFRLEEPAGAVASAYPLVDEYALASRLSYFLWSSTPDQRLLELADRQQLRSNLVAQVQRMVADPRSEALVHNFLGQWLQLRDLDGISIDARVVLARDQGHEQELRKDQEEFRARLAKLNASSPGKTNAAASPPAKPFHRRFGPPAVELDHDLRQAMLRETELFFSGVLHQDRPVTELIDSDYTFLNEKLAKLYGLTNVTGKEMRRVSLPADCPRGGILTDASVLVVTSNPDRTSPVKRGLFVLDNLLGAPIPPPPANVPALEATEKQFKEHEPTLRESLTMHRDKPLCASCHSRMDPVGLAFENFNALGMWRESERGQTIDPSGKLMTGESFQDVQELKRILLEQHRSDFYRCLTEKLLTYALGRGLEFYDAETVDRIVARLECQNGRFSELLMGIIESAPFQKQRNRALAVTDAAENPSAAKLPPKNKTSL